MPHPGIVFMRMIAPLPLSWLRGLGSFLGWVLYTLAAPRRKVVLANLALCFPNLPLAERARLARQSFIFFAQAFLDRSWLWHGRPKVVRKRLCLTGAVGELEGHAQTIIFAPHFYGLDAGATALSLLVERRFITIYTPQPNPDVDTWIRDGRQRFGRVRLFYRADGLKPVVAALRAGDVLYLLPDMNFGPQESIFVPFFGVPAATVPSLSRLARLGRAKVVPLTTRMTTAGYEVLVHPSWKDFPTEDLEADTARMNRTLEAYINTMPAQYYWVHKRFKTRPPGEAAVY
jgi:KDO2-lipid IV(A) lauroyltransferase